jgi:hypothetical protein
MYSVVINNQVVFTSDNFKVARRCAFDKSGEYKAVASLYANNNRLIGQYEVRR